MKVYKSPHRDRSPRLCECGFVLPLFPPVGRRRINNGNAAALLKCQLATRRHGIVFVARGHSAGSRLRARRRNCAIHLRPPRHHLLCLLSRWTTTRVCWPKETKPDLQPLTSDRRSKGRRRAPASRFRRRLPADRRTKARRVTVRGRRWRPRPSQLSRRLLLAATPRRSGAFHPTSIHRNATHAHGRCRNL